jgi:SAM-dependent methyltransferase
MANADNDHRSRTAHWAEVWRAGAPSGRSWFQHEPQPSLDLITAACPARDAPIIDIGAGASVLVDRLLALGYSDLSVLDIAPEALDLSRERLGEPASRIGWIVADITRWTPPRHYRLWHDRAVFHFLTKPAEQAAYADCLRAAMAPGGQAIIATFAPEGPDTCSGLKVQRHDAVSLMTALGTGFVLVETRREAHRTPAGREQSFMWFRLEREASGTFGQT